MKIKLFDRSTCIKIAKDVEHNRGTKLEDLDNIPTSNLLHDLPNFVFSGDWFPVVHIQYDGDGDPKTNEKIGYNICVNSYSTAYFIPTYFVSSTDKQPVKSGVNIVDLNCKNSIQYT